MVKVGTFLEGSVSSYIGDLFWITLRESNRKQTSHRSLPNQFSDTPYACRQRNDDMDVGACASYFGQASQLLSRKVRLFGPESGFHIFSWPLRSLRPHGVDSAGNSALGRTTLALLGACISLCCRRHPPEHFNLNSWRTCTFCCLQCLAKGRMYNAGCCKAHAVSESLRLSSAAHQLAGENVSALRVFAILPMGILSRHEQFEKPQQESRD